MMSMGVEIDRVLLSRKKNNCGASIKHLQCLGGKNAAFFQWGQHCTPILSLLTQWPQIQFSAFPRISFDVA